MFTIYAMKQYPVLWSFVYVLEGTVLLHLFIPPFLEQQGNDSIQELFSQCLLCVLDTIRTGEL